MSIANQPEGLWQSLSTPLEEDIFLDQDITDIEFADGLAQKIQLNGKSFLQAKHFIFCNHLHWILEKMGEADSSMAAKLRKLKWFSTVNVIYNHREVAESPIEWDQPYLLMGSKEQPCLGMFRRLEDGSVVSHWQCLIPAELTLDPETTGSAVKEIKKQAKRAFASLWAKPPLDHIVVYEKDLANLEVFGGNPSNFKNLDVLSPGFDGRWGWLYDVLLAEELPLDDPSPEPSPAPPM